tara:strand:+ start:4780 stop:4992 length:213 start_codon:yes stop_codon:yes gene_type:complete
MTVDLDYAFKNDQGNIIAKAKIKDPKELDNLIGSMVNGMVVLNYETWDQEEIILTLKAAERHEKEKGTVG